MSSPTMIDAPCLWCLNIRIILPELERARLCRVSNRRGLILLQRVGINLL